MLENFIVLTKIIYFWGSKTCTVFTVQCALFAFGRLVVVAPCDKSFHRGPISGPRVSRHTHASTRSPCEHAPRSLRELVYALVPASKSACVELSQSLCARALAFASFEPMPSAWQILPCGLHGGMRGPRQVATAGRMAIRPNMPERRRQWPPGPSACEL